MSTSNEESLSRRSFPGHAEVLNHAAVHPSNSVSGTSSSPTSVKIGVPMVVSTTSTSTITTALASPVNPNKKHNLGYRIRRLLFPQFRSTTGTTLSKHKSTKDVENNENQNFLKHSTSLYSNSSGDSDHRSISSKRRRTRNQSQQTDTVADYPTLSNPSPSVPRPNAQGLLECSICLLEQTVSQFPELSTCHHRACLNCLRQYIRIEIFESRVNITCPECTEQLHPNDIKAILRNDLNLMDKYESFMVRRILITDPDARWCPAPDCDYCVIASGCASCPKLKCERPGCETLFCYHCKQEWHPNQTCDQARAQRGTSRSFFGPVQTKSGGVTFSSRSTDSNQAHSSNSGDPSFLQRDDIKPCPCCKVLIIKMDDGSCNHMTCSVCGTEFCWLCMQKISDLHYLSPSGCTFWGKKPWSRKKKIMWQLGMLVGAPVGIALIAGIAVPAIIIGIPVWVGRKLYARFERNNLSRHKSNLLVTTGVLTSIFVSPILAAVAVGIGVPILLAYVYGVVPISLCRSGGCGVITSSSGVRIELDEDEISANAATDAVSVDTALSGHRGIANPSIGEVSLGMSTSLSIGSSSHLDRVVLDIQPDRESSSIAACAGSITSNTLTNNAVHSSMHHNKLETQADIISNKRFSFSSQNADATSVTLSFGDRSINTNVSSVDDASLKVHTGSIRDGPSQANANYSLSPVEVHVNIEEDDSNESVTKSVKSTQTKSKPITTGEANSILGKYESRSLEYLTSNYCKICHKSHKPCCPNFQHPNSSIKIGKFSQAQEEENTSIAINSDNKSNDTSADTLSEAENTIRSNSNHTESQCDQLASAIVIECDKQLPHLSSGSHSNESTRSTLSKKAISQIFYPSSHYSGNVGVESMPSAMASNSPKSGLSHSLSFTHNHNLISDSTCPKPNYML